MKRTIIPAGTPGTFRPEWGQFPESDTKVMTWARHIPEAIFMKGWEVANTARIYAWQYAPVAPPADGLEAFKEGWKSFEILAFSEFGPYTWLRVTKSLAFKTFTHLGHFPTLAAAQEAAYKHFLSTLND